VLPESRIQSARRAAEEWVCSRLGRPEQVIATAVPRSSCRLRFPGTQSNQRAEVSRWWIQPAYSPAVGDAEVHLRNGIGRRRHCQWPSCRSQNAARFRPTPPHWTVAITSSIVAGLGGQGREGTGSSIGCDLQGEHLGSTPPGKDWERQAAGRRAGLGGGPSTGWQLLGQGPSGPACSRGLSASGRILRFADVAERAAAAGCQRRGDRASL